MTFNKKLKLLLFVLSLIVCIQARSLSVSQIGDIRIQKFEDKWICDQIECPLDADRCYVSKSNVKNPNEIERSNICYSKDNKVLKEKVTSTKTDPKNILNVQVVSHADGAFSSYNSGRTIDFDEEKFRKEFESNLRQREVDLQSRIADFQANLNPRIQNLHSNKIHYENNLSQIGDIRIQKFEDKWVCDQIECPLDADRCYVSKSNAKNPNEIERSNICYSKDNKVLKEKVTSTKTDPKNILNVQVVSHADGAFSSYNSGSTSDFDEEKFRREFESNLRQREADIQSRIADFQANLNRRIQNLHSNLQTRQRDIQLQTQNFLQNLRFQGPYQDKIHYENDDGDYNFY